MMGGLTPSLLAVDEDERHAARPVAAVRPGVVRPALDQHVPGAHQRLVLVEQRPHLAVEDDRVVERRRLVEPPVPPVAALGAGLLVAGAADLAEQLRHVDVVVGAVGREVRDAQDRAVRRRGHRRDATGRRRVLLAVERRRRAVRGPQDRRDELRHRRRGAAARRGPVAEDDRPPVRAVAGDDPAHRGERLLGFDGDDIRATGVLVIGHVAPQLRAAANGSACSDGHHGYCSAEALKRLRSVPTPSTSSSTTSPARRCRPSSSAEPFPTVPEPMMSPGCSRSAIETYAMSSARRVDRVPRSCRSPTPHR